MDSYSSRFASGRISPNLDPQVGDCWLDTTGELRRAQRPGRYKVPGALPMLPGQRALRNGRPRPPRQTVHGVRPRLPGECCRPNRWQRGDRRALAAHALRSRPARSIPARHVKARTRLPGVGRQRGGHYRVGRTGLQGTTMDSAHRKANNSTVCASRPQSRCSASSNR